MKTYIFGPVPSRRLGVSLGVDLTPTKTCSYDCLYCQLSKTIFHTSKRDSFCDPNKVLEELREVLSQTDKPDWITFSGTGEPTLHLDIGLILAEVKKLNIAPTCVITNSSLMHIPEVRQSLLLADRILPTITTVNSKSFVRIHRPTNDIRLENILEGIRIFSSQFTGKIEIEIFVCPSINDTPKEIEGLSTFLSSLDNLESIYLNTAIRMPLESEIKTADQGVLNNYRNALNLNIKITTAFEHSFIPPHSSSWNRPAVSSDILKLLLRHPCSKIQLEQVFDSDTNKIKNMLNELLHAGKIRQSPNGDWSLIN